MFQMLFTFIIIEKGVMEMIWNQVQKSVKQNAVTTTNVEDLSFLGYTATSKLIVSWPILASKQHILKQFILQCLVH